MVDTRFKKGNKLGGGSSRKGIPLKDPVAEDLDITINRAQVILQKETQRLLKELNVNKKLGVDQHRILEQLTKTLIAFRKEKRETKKERNYNSYSKAELKEAAKKALGHLGLSLDDEPDLTEGKSEELEKDGGEELAIEEVGADEGNDA